MDWHNAQFLLATVEEQQFPKMKRPEVVLAGRSNVGKSTLINCLTAQSGLAKTSGRPGKTQTINFYDIDETIYLVDLPGYGFAKVPHEMKKNWGATIDEYFSALTRISLLVLLVDTRRGIEEEELQLLEVAMHRELPTLIVRTKSDALKNQKEHTHYLKQFKLSLPFKDLPIISFSKNDGHATNALRKTINAYLSP